MGIRLKLRRWHKLIVEGLLLAFVAFNALAAWQAWVLTHPISWDKKRANVNRSRWLTAVAVPDADINSDTVVRVPGVEEIRFESGHGYALAGWLQSDERSTQSIIMCHGHGASRFSLQAEADVFRELGYRVLLFDFRAHGESSGTVCSVGVREALDVKAAWDHLINKYPDSPITIYGVSMGAVAVAKAVADHDLKPDKLILDMPFNRLLDAVRNRILLAGLPAEPLATMVTFWGGVEQGFWPFSFSTADCTKRISCPVLLQRGGDDSRVGAEEIDHIAAAAGEEITVHTYPGVGHVSLCKNAPSAWKANVREFLK